MTGNLVLAGLVHRADYAHTLVGGGASVAAFCLAAFTAFRVTRPDGPWAGSVARVLLTAAAVQLAILTGWFAAKGAPSADAQVGLVALSAVAMGLQTVATKRLSAGPGITTTFVTGTLTGLIQDLAERRTGGRLVRAAVVASLTVGALTGALAIAWHPELGPIVPSAFIWLALILVLGSR